MAAKQTRKRLDWYRTEIADTDLQRHKQRDMASAWALVGGHMALFLLTSLWAIFAYRHGSPLHTGIAIFVHGTIATFQINGIHELAHGTVFPSRALNRFFFRLYCFLRWENPYRFWASHSAHHSFTLHPPDDFEVLPETEVRLPAFIAGGFLSPFVFLSLVARTFRAALGGDTGPESDILSKTEGRKLLHNNWAGLVIAGHAIVFLGSLYFDYWMVFVLVSLAPLYGSMLFRLCNTTQHAGLPGNTTDFRVCSRTIRLSPVLEYLYWYMNYHIEHHMYPAIPCYRLRDLHTSIKHDLPPTQHGLFATWREILAIQTRRNADASYRYIPELPAHE